MTVREPSPEEAAISRFSNAMLRIRYVVLNDDGELTGCWSLRMEDVGWNVPAVGDRYFRTHDVGDYDSYMVAHRMLVEEGLGPTYWLIVLKDEEASPFLAGIADHMMLVTDLERAQADGDPQDEITARLQQLCGAPSGRMRIKPRSRDPEPDRE